MKLSNPKKATAVFLALTAMGLGLANGAKAHRQGENPFEVQKRTNFHSRAVCTDKAPGKASCLSHVIDNGADNPEPLAGTAPYGASPAQIKAAYNFPTSTTAGAGQTIAVIGAFDNPTVHNDLQVFSNTYGLPCNDCLTKLNQTGGTTSFGAFNEAWAKETNLDVQWVHAIAPGAKILLVQGNTNNWSDLAAAITTAKARGATYISMSFGGPEGSVAGALESVLADTNVSFFAAAGDSGLGAYYPSSSPRVISVGGTQLGGLGTSTLSESAWSSGGGGCSSVYSATSAQAALSTYAQTGCGTKRATPDVAMNGSPWSGVSVYNTSGSDPGWLKLGGTSVSAPLFAARSAVSGVVINSSRVYGTWPPPFYDVTSGNNGAAAVTGFDLASGRGSWNDGASRVAPTTATATVVNPTLINGGFESQLEGWTPAGSAAAVTGSQMGGTYSAQLGNPTASNGDSTLKQTFTMPSDANVVSLWYKQTCGDTPGAWQDWAKAYIRDNTTFATVQIFDPICATTANYVNARVTSLVPGRGYTITLLNHDNNVSGTSSFIHFDTILTYGDGTVSTTSTTTSTTTAPTTSSTTSSTTTTSTTAATAAPTTTTTVATTTTAKPPKKPRR